MTYTRSQLIIINRKKQIRQRILIAILAAFLLAVLSFLFFSSDSIASDGSEEDLYKYYKYVQISGEETIYDIADTYGNADIISNKNYISEVLFMNNLDSEDAIESGMYLVVPYFDSRHPYT